MRTNLLSKLQTALPFAVGIMVGLVALAADDGAPAKSEPKPKPVPVSAAPAPVVMLEPRNEGLAALDTYRDDVDASHAAIASYRD